MGIVVSTIFGANEIGLEPQTLGAGDAYDLTGGGGGRFTLQSFSPAYWHEGHHYGYHVHHYWFD